MKSLKHSVGPKESVLDNSGSPELSGFPLDTPTNLPDPPAHLQGAGQGILVLLFGTLVLPLEEICLSSLSLGAQSRVEKILRRGGRYSHGFFLCRYGLDRVCAGWFGAGNLRGFVSRQIFRL